MRIRASKTPPLSSISTPNPPPSVLPPSIFHASNESTSRCEGLDLLVLAVIQVFGDRALEVERIGKNGVGDKEGKQERIEKRMVDPDDGVEAGPEKKRRKRQLSVPSRFHDSVMQPWKRRTQRRPDGAKLPD